MFVEVKTVIFYVLLLQAILSLISAQCPQQEYQLVNERQVINITSPNYPNAYRPGSSCRYRIRAPTNYVVVLNCNYEVVPNACGSERLFVSADGDLQFRDAVTYCRTQSSASVSNFRSISVAYVSSSSSTTQRARFICQASARRQPCQCGWTQPTRISNGRETVRHEYPSMVALRDLTSIQRIFCGGSIISHQYILSAAHCMRAHSDVGRIIAYVGDHDLVLTTESPFAVQHRIQQIIIHPRYASTPSGELNDIALLRTVLPIEWSRGVGPICLPLRKSAETFAYMNVAVIGWGTLTFAGSKSNTLQKVQLMALDNASCQRQYNATIMPSHICTYDYRGIGQDSCQFDSGGPVILSQQKLFLVGVISFGNACGVPRYSIGVNTRITTHLQWLWRYVGGSICTV